MSTGSLHQGESAVAVKVNKIGVLTSKGDADSINAAIREALIKQWCP